MPFGSNHNGQVQEEINAGAPNGALKLTLGFKMNEDDEDQKNIV